MMRLYLIGLLLSLSFYSFAQEKTIVMGSVIDLKTNETIIGAILKIKGTSNGVITDFNGSFVLETTEPLPYLLEISSLGYDSRTIKVVKDEQTFAIFLKETQTIGEELVVSASRIEERILESPVTIEKMPLLAIRHTPSANYYNGLADLKGVQMNTSSFSFSSINARGFADMQNWRFIQWLDGMETSAPGLSYSVGGISSTTELDLRNIEFVPGASSALYGANAFNGVLTMDTKNPFDYKGLSAYVKGGITVQDAGGVNPFGDIGIRFAQTIKNKFGYKINFSYLRAYDWEADNTSNRIGIGELEDAATISIKDRSTPDYDGVNIYGDEFAIQIPGLPFTVSRTGIHERDLVDYNINNYKVGGGLYYRFKDDLELSYTGRFVQADAILRHTTIYPLKNIRQQYHKLELKDDNLFARSYFSKENSNNSYVLGLAAISLNNALKSNDAWFQDFGAAYAGLVPNIQGGDATIARQFADRDVPLPNSTEFETAYDSIIANPDLAQGGALFVDKSSFWHNEAGYNFKDIVKWLDIQIGANHRRYLLDSDGRLFNDGKDGFNKAIPINEYGAYVQLGKKLFNDRVNLRGSVRFDKNQNFKGRFTPRASIVTKMDNQGKHVLRLSGQTGFRNPAAQEAYIALDGDLAFLLGGVQENINNFNYNGIKGIDIYNDLTSLQDGEALNLNFLKQERIFTWEIGYKALITNRLLIDLNYYQNYYENFVTRAIGYSKLTNKVFDVYTNIEDGISSMGAGIGAEYLFKGNYRIGINYSFINFNADNALKNNPNFIPSFNTPNHRANLALENRDVWKGFGFSTRLRWADEHVWQSPFGENTIDSYFVLDAALTYKVKPWKTFVKVGATNLLNQEYNQVYGGPKIGGQYYVSLLYDQLFEKK